MRIDKKGYAFSVALSSLTSGGHPDLRQRPVRGHHCARDGADGDSGLLSRLRCVEPPPVPAHHLRD